MPNEELMTHKPGAGAGSAGLPASVFYGVIIAGIILGIAACMMGGWIYLDCGAEKPVGRRIWAGIADQLLVPVCVMIGATFGGLAGVALAIACDSRFRKRYRQ